MTAVTSTQAPAAPSPVRVGVAVAVAVLATVAFLVALVIWEDRTIVDVVTYIGIPLTFGGVGAYLTIRVPTNPIGPLLLGATVAFALLVGGGAIAFYGVGIGEITPVTMISGFFGNLSFLPGLVIVLVGIPLVFPDGRFLSPRWRWVAWAAAIATVAAELRALFGTPTLLEGTFLPNPLYIERAADALATIDRLTSIAAVPIFAATVASLVLRYRRGDDIQRHQIRWLGATVSVAVITYSISFFSPEEIQNVLSAIGILTLNAVPVSIGIAVVRYRLYDIDRLISRGISYAIVSALLLGAYVAAVLVLQGPLGTLFGSQTVTVAVSTLVVAALFQPVRRRVQAVIDRRFDRARVDAERTTIAFSDRLRAEVDIDAVVADLAATAHGAVRPTSVQLWLRDPGVGAGT